MLFSVPFVEICRDRLVGGLCGHLTVLFFGVCMGYRCQGFVVVFPAVAVVVGVVPVPVVLGAGGGLSGFVEASAV